MYPCILFIENVCLAMSYFQQSVSKACERSITRLRVTLSTIIEKVAFSRLGSSSC